MKRSRESYRKRWREKFDRESGRSRRAVAELIAAIAPTVAKLPPEDWGLPSELFERRTTKRRPWDPKR